MCGIFGFTGFQNDNLLKKMGQTIAHRGPDDQDEYFDGNIGLGYRRLAIIDTKGSYQPLFNEDKNIVLFFNGEIYNYQELRKSLSKHKFRTNGDGETIIHLYEDHGPAVFKNLNGIFGFALYDKKKNKLLLVRDHFGIKPLYYWTDGKRSIFASEIKAILPVLKSLKIPFLPNDQTIYKYLQTRLHDDDTETFFAGILRVPSGSYLQLDLKTSEQKINNYWELKTNPNLVKETDQENIEEFRRLFFQAIKRQLMSEVPVGTALSGGLDSSAVVLAVNKCLKEFEKVLGEKQKTFSAIFPGEVNNEKGYIDTVHQKATVDPYFVQPKKEELWKDVEKLISAQDEPMISSGPYAQWRVMQLAHQKGIRVMLDGQGADEMLAGYDPYFFVYFKELFRNGQYFTLIKEAILCFPILKKYLVSKKGFSTASLFQHNEMSRETKAPVIRDNLNSRLQEDIFHRSLPSLLRYEDHNSMAHSIEARVPFLDVDLVVFVASLPANYKIRNGQTKWIMRQALKDLLPDKILNRKWKVGFTTPEIAWMRSSAKEVRQIISSDSFNRRPYFNSENIRIRFEEFVSGQNNESMVFWRIINLELWLRKFID